MSNTLDEKQLYDQQKRGAAAPIYSPTEDKYRSDKFTKLSTAYQIRESSHMEFNDMTYSESYLRNRQQDMAYNPPKRNPADSRLVSGITHEKDSTILSILMQMNFQPKIRVFDEDNVELYDASTILTAKLKKTLIKDNFRDKLSDFLRVNIAQGNAFVEERRVQRWKAKKTPLNKTSDPSKTKWKTVLEKEDEGCTSVLVPNTAVFLGDITQSDIYKQPYVFVVMHVPTVEVARVFKDFPRWKNVPKFPTDFIPVNVDGIWGDYYLQRPMQDFTEVIIYQSMPDNEYQVYLNGVQMFPVQEENGVITGYPLTEFSPSGKYTIAKADNERIAFFAYGRSTPSKTEVKEETMNELMRLMVYKMRQSAKPPVGNNSDKVLQSNVWDPGVITPDIRQEELSILTPNAGITGADFSFYNLIQQSVAESSVSASVEGTNQNELTATQYLDQKRENLKKLGLSIDNTINFLRDIYWLRLYSELGYFKKKDGKYNTEDDMWKKAYESFVADENIDGVKGSVEVNFVDSNEGRTDNQFMKSIMEEEEKRKSPTRIMFARPEYIQDIVENLKDKIYIDVVAEPEGQEAQLIAALFNLLMQYTNLRGGQTENINFDYLEKVIGDNSGFDAKKLFKKPEPNPMGGGMLPPGTPPVGAASAPRPSFIPQNKTRQVPNAVLAK